MEQDSEETGAWMWYVQDVGVVSVGTGVDLGFEGGRELIMDLDPPDERLEGAAKVGVMMTGNEGRNEEETACAKIQVQVQLGMLGPHWQV
jgi:hypothetical protein